MADYPIPAFHFQVDWGGTRIGFSEVTGLSFETQVLEYRDGSMPEYTVQKMPGMPKFGNLTMKRGVFEADNEFFDWYNEIKLNKITRRDLVISLLNEEHEPVATWRVANAWPTKITSPDLKATGNEVAIESMEVAFETMTLENG